MMRRWIAIRIVAGLLVGIAGSASGAEQALGNPIEAPAAVSGTNPSTDNTFPAPPPSSLGKDGAQEVPNDNGTGSIEGESLLLAGGEQPPPATVADPIEPFNRAIFTINDKAYYWILKPVAQGYNFVVPQGVRVAVRNFFSNLATPIRVANNLLQGKFRAGGTELLRFTINSTVGFAGFFDPAHDGFHLEKKKADFGQTLGKYGLGQGLYLVLPILGPTTLRDGVGFAGDLFLDPVSYVRPVKLALGIDAYRWENNLSLRIGEYEDLTGSALDPYVAARDAYAQHRAEKVREK
jgi:phospholipid-binding lipoprotein MlaA